MQTLTQLESKILDLQAQIQATQAQITDYQKLYVLYRICEVCKYKEKYVSGSGIVICPICNNENRKYVGGAYSIGMGIITENSKKQELDKAQAQLATLQNELKTTQAQYEQAKAQDTARTMILNQSFVSPPPPTIKNLSSQKVLKEIESLQSYLRGE